MTELYTNPQGNTPQGQDVNNALKTLLSLGTIPSQMPDSSEAAKMSADYSGKAMKAYADMPSQMQQTQQNLIQAAGIPKMSNQYTLDYDTFTKMFQNDPMGQKIVAEQVAKNYPGMTATGPESIDAALANINKPYGGNVTPMLGMDIASSQAGSYADVMNSLATLISGNLSKAGTQYGQDQSNYMAGIGLLSSLAEMMKNQAEIAQTKEQTASAKGTSIQQSTADLFNTLVDQVSQTGGTEQDLWNIINQNQDTYKAAGYDVNLLWKLHKSIASKVGWQGKIGQSIGTKTSAASIKDQQKKQADLKAHGDALRGFGNLMRSYYMGAVKVGAMGTMLDPNARKKYESARKVYIGQLQKSLGVGRGKYNFETLNQSLPNENVALGYEGSFQGHLTSLLDNAGLILYRDKKTGETGVVDESVFDPGIEERIDPMSTPGNELMKILVNL